MTKKIIKENENGENEKDNSNKLSVTNKDIKNSSSEDKTSTDDKLVSDARGRRPSDSRLRQPAQSSWIRIKRIIKCITVGAVFIGPIIGLYFGAAIIKKFLLRWKAIIIFQEMIMRKSQVPLNDQKMDAFLKHSNDVYDAMPKIEDLHQMISFDIEYNSIQKFNRTLPDHSWQDLWDETKKPIVAIDAQVHGSLSVEDKTLPLYWISFDNWNKLPKVNCTFAEYCATFEMTSAPFQARNKYHVAHMTKFPWFIQKSLWNFRHNIVGDMSVLHPTTNATATWEEWFVDVEKHINEWAKEITGHNKPIDFKRTKTPYLPYIIMYQRPPIQHSSLDFQTNFEVGCDQIYEHSYQLHNSWNPLKILKYDERSEEYWFHSGFLKMIHHTMDWKKRESQGFLNAGAPLEISLGIWRYCFKPLVPESTPMFDGWFVLAYWFRVVLLQSQAGRVKWSTHFRQFGNLRPFSGNAMYKNAFTAMPRIHMAKWFKIILQQMLDNKTAKQFLNNFKHAMTVHNMRDCMTNVIGDLESEYIKIGFFKSRRALKFREHEFWNLYLLGSSDFASDWERIFDGLERNDFEEVDARLGNFHPVRFCGNYKDITPRCDKNKNCYCVVEARSGISRFSNRIHKPWKMFPNHIHHVETKDFEPEHQDPFFKTIENNAFILSDELSHYRTRELINEPILDDETLKNTQLILPKN